MVTEKAQLSMQYCYKNTIQYIGKDREDDDPTTYGS